MTPDPCFSDKFERFFLAKMMIITAFTFRAINILFITGIVHYTTDRKVGTYLFVTL
jgi:hypothetical protein